MSPRTGTAQHSAGQTVGEWPSVPGKLAEQVAGELAEGCEV